MGWEGASGPSSEHPDIIGISSQGGRSVTGNVPGRGVDKQGRWKDREQVELPIPTRKEPEREDWTCWRLSLQAERDSQRVLAQSSARHAALPHPASLDGAFCVHCGR